MHNDAQYFNSIFDSDKDPYQQNYHDFEKAKYRIRSDSLILDKCLGIDAPNKYILDIGCGIGTLTDKIARNCNPRYIAGIDFSDIAIEKACELYPEVIYFKRDICAVDFSFDIGIRFNIFILNRIFSGIHDYSTVIFNICSIAEGSFYLLVVNDINVSFDWPANMPCAIISKSIVKGDTYSFEVFLCEK